MEFYKAKDKFIIGIKGGRFHSLKSDPEAIILSERPVPAKRWAVDRITDRTLEKGQEWSVDTEIRAYTCDKTGVFILQFTYSRTSPGYRQGTAEFFVSEEYAKEKIAALRKVIDVQEYTWNEVEGTWDEIRRKKYYRKAGR